MNQETQDRGRDGGAFDAVDPKLTIYALANGMDLKRQEGSRRLEWHRDGLERGILLESDPAGAISVWAVAWSHGDEASMRKSACHEGLPSEALARDLSSVLEETLGAANAL